MKKGSMRSARTEAPPPAAGTWGDHPPLPSQLEQAILERKEGGTLRSVIQILECDPKDELAAALARLGKAVQTRNGHKLKWHR
jgi:hypothetical protein